jgi:hypothetical protein
MLVKTISAFLLTASPWRPRRAQAGQERARLASVSEIGGVNTTVAPPG